EGRYTIERELGAGGMATVYLAQDIKHDRKVAVKVLKPELAAVLGAERFVQEIKTTAALQHPHILPLFDSGEAYGPDTSGPFLFYVMPFIDGETLREKLNRETQLGIDEAVKITTEIADALHYAHGNNVIHRDIKPENILLHNGRPMVADFGIALAVSAAAGGRMTETGMSLGTPHYMSPEQATADKELTNRSDIYSLGSVLYEMLTGDPPHTGSSAQQIIMKIVTEDPAAVTKLRRSVPANVAEAVAMSLEKIPADRFANAKAFADALISPVFSRGITGSTVSIQADSRWRMRFTVLVFVTSIVAIWGLWGWLGSNEETEREVVRFEMPVTGGLIDVASPQLAISRDGRKIAYVGMTETGIRGLFVRPLDRLEATAVIDGAYGPVFSPDNEFLAFGEPDGSISVISTDGSFERGVHSETGRGFEIGWGDDGYIYSISNDGSVIRFPDAGGESEVVVERDTISEIYNFPGFPEPLPGGRGVIVTFGRGPNRESDIAVVDLETGEVHYLLKGYFGRYADGFLFFAKLDGSLMYVPFDLKTLKTTGPERATGISVFGNLNREDEAHFAVSESGTLVYRPLGNLDGRSFLAFVDRDGSEEVVDSDLWRSFQSVSLSPDGGRIAMSISGAGQEAIWTYDLEARTISRLTFDGTTVFRPLWSHDGTRIAYMSDRGSDDLVRSGWIQPADGSGAPELFVESTAGRPVQEISWSSDGTSIAYREGFSDGETLRDIWMLRAGADTLRRPILATGADEQNPKVSPDGRWLAYKSDESGVAEIYVRPFPEGEGRWQISVGGGSEPLWARNGRELFYRSTGGDMISVPVLAGPNFRTGPPQVLFSTNPYLVDGNATSYDITPDGSRFLMIKKPGEESLIVVVNWTEELRRQ
ncbi:MAG: protein kinase, partial [Gemmatimonadota bacterium]|nr:protein kinase [Gemmatimonadota bacterium]